MTGAGAPTLRVDPKRWSGLRVAIVSATWHQQVMDGLRAGAMRIAQEARIQTEEFRVQGSFELPVVAAECAGSGRFDAIVALGVVIRGGTPHFDYVCSAASDGLMTVTVSTGVPVGFGLLTCDTEQQALERAGLPGSSEDKGAEAMVTALDTASVIRDLRVTNGDA